MRPRPLEESDFIALSPNRKLIVGIRDMAFIAALPSAGQGIHPVSSARLIDGDWGVLENDLQLSLYRASAAPSILKR